MSTKIEASRQLQVHGDVDWGGHRVRNAADPAAAQDLVTRAYLEAYADAGDAATLRAAEAYADAGDGTTLTAAQAYANTGDAATLASAQAYTDTAIASGGGGSMVYDMGTW